MFLTCLARSERSKEDESEWAGGGGVGNLRVEVSQALIGYPRVKVGES